MSDFNEIYRICNNKSALESKIRFAEGLIDASKTCVIESMSIKIKDVFGVLTDDAKQSVRIALWSALQASVSEHQQVLNTAYSPAGIAGQLSEVRNDSR